ncbi:MAG: class A beta-lactamase-related serine hydrolase [Lachnospiraceae bacterium]|nr:class A beta-lactamase-related serine hydrolase [Lachnospiraceae bacterium]
METGKGKTWSETWENLLPRLEAMPGRVSVVCKNLNTGEALAYRPDEPHPAASVIKLFLMAAVFQGFADQTISPQERILVRDKDCVPSCGVLTYLKGDRELCVRDLVELMIIVSDNTATNLLFDRIREEQLDAFIRGRLGLEKTVFRRKMFDARRASQGIENYVTAADAAWLLEMIYTGWLISPEASCEMFQILTHQRLNGKIPFYLHTLADAPVIAHKTGEDTGITHDVAIIAHKTRKDTGITHDVPIIAHETGADDGILHDVKRTVHKAVVLPGMTSGAPVDTHRVDGSAGDRRDAPAFVLCFLGSGTDVPAYERLMAEAAWELYYSAQT